VDRIKEIGKKRYKFLPGVDGRKLIELNGTEWQRVIREDINYSSSGWYLSHWYSSKGK
jgi:hypothetical protein